MRPLQLTASYYQQYDADETLDVPGEGYGGWRRSDATLDLDHTAVVIMHAWETGKRTQFPGWYRAVEYIPRAQCILAEVFPPLLGAIRDHGVTLLHVVGGGDYYRTCPGYQRALSLVPAETALEQAAPDAALQQLQQFRAHHVFVGVHNREDVDHGFAQLDFAPEARPLDSEGVAENATQLFALCKETGINHLVYAGFAINWCLLMSPGGMLDMSRHGLMCSVLRQAVTAVENRESARHELHKEEALWRVALQFGFVFDVDNFIRSLM